MNVKVLFIFLVGLFFLSAVSADTSFRGDVRDTNLFIGALVEGASVTVTCNGFTNSSVSNVNGIYGVNFLETECNVSDSYLVVAVEGNRSGNSSGVVDSNDMMVYLAIVENVVDPVVLNTTISGIVYYDVLGGELVDGASVTVTCNGVDADVVLSGVDGSYSVDFLESVCNDSHVYSVFAVEGEYNGTSGDLNVVDGVVVDVAIVKPEVKPEVVKSSGGWVRPDCAEGFYYEAGVGCILDEVVVEAVEEKTEEVEDLVVSEGVGEGVDTGFASLLTGAVIGGGVGSWVVVLVFVGLVLVVFFLTWKK